MEKRKHVTGLAGHSQCITDLQHSLQGHLRVSVGEWINMECILPHGDSLTTSSAPMSSHHCFCGRLWFVYLHSHSLWETYKKARRLWLRVLSQMLPNNNLLWIYKHFLAVRRVEVVVFWFRGSPQNAAATCCSFVRMVWWAPIPYELAGIIVSDWPSLESFHPSIPTYALCYHFGIVRSFSVIVSVVWVSQCARITWASHATYVENRKSNYPNWNHLLD